MNNISEPWKKEARKEIRGNEDSLTNSTTKITRPVQVQKSNRRNEERREKAAAQRGADAASGNGRMQQGRAST
jgi:hypothetical protein